MTEPTSEFSAQDRHEAALDGLVEANQTSNSTMIRLIEQVRKDTETRDRKITAMEHQQKQLRWAIILVCVGIAVLLVVAGINATNIASTRKAQKNTEVIARSVDVTNKTLLDCINETGECGRSDAARQKELLDEVKLYELTGFYCIRNNPATADPQAEAFLKCMQDLYPGGPVLDRDR